MVTLGSEVLVCFVELGKDLTEKKNQKSLQKINFSVKFYATAFITGFKLIQRKHVWYKYLLTKVRLFFKKLGENHDQLLFIIGITYICGPSDIFHLLKQEAFFSPCCMLHINSFRIIIFRFRIIMF